MYQLSSRPCKTFENRITGVSVAGSAASFADSVGGFLAVSETRQ